MILQNSVMETAEDLIEKQAAELALTSVAQLQRSSAHAFEAFMMFST
jgi:hypothetical protein